MTDRFDDTTRASDALPPTEALLPAVETPPAAAPDTEVVAKPLPLVTQANRSSFIAAANHILDATAALTGTNNMDYMNEERDRNRALGVYQNAVQLEHAANAALHAMGERPRKEIAIKRSENPPTADQAIERLREKGKAAKSEYDTAQWSTHDLNSGMKNLLAAVSGLERLSVNEEKIAKTTKAKVPEAAVV